jgi:hypothetical protein
MKKIVVAFLPLLVCLNTSFSSLVNCDTEKAKSTCVTKLDAGYTVLKTYSLESQKKEFSYIFSKGINYTLSTALSDNAEAQIEIQLLDKEKKLILTNYNKRKNEFYKVIYPCTQTGIHYISFIDHSNKSMCGAAVLGFKGR